MTGPVGSRVSSSIKAAVLEYLATSSMAMASPRMPGPGPAVLLRDAQSEQAGVTEGLEEVLGICALLVDRPSPWFHLVLGQAPDGSLQLRQLVGEVENHGRRLSDLPNRYFLGS